MDDELPGTGVEVHAVTDETLPFAVVLLNETAGATGVRRAGHDVIGWRELADRRGLRGPGERGDDERQAHDHGAAPAGAASPWIHEGTSMPDLHGFAGRYSDKTHDRTIFFPRSS